MLAFLCFGYSENETNSAECTFRILNTAAMRFTDAEVTSILSTREKYMQHFNIFK